MRGTVAPVMRLLEGAQINAGLIELPFTSGEAIDQPADKKEEAESPWHRPGKRLQGTWNLRDRMASRLRLRSR